MHELIRGNNKRERAFQEEAQQHILWKYDRYSMTTEHRGHGMDKTVQDPTVNGIEEENKGVLFQMNRMFYWFWVKICAYCKN